MPFRHGKQNLPVMLVYLVGRHCPHLARREVTGGVTVGGAAGAELIDGVGRLGKAGGHGTAVFGKGIGGGKRNAAAHVLQNRIRQGGERNVRPKRAEFFQVSLLAQERFPRGGDLPAQAGQLFAELSQFFRIRFTSSFISW